MRRHLLLPAIVLTVVAACGDGGGDEQVAAAERPRSPIEEFFDLPTGLDDDQQEEFAEQARIVEEKVRDCMVGRGFEYTPTTQPTSVMPADDEYRQAMELPPEEFVARYGLGISTFDNFGSVEGDGFGEEMPVDPNQERVEQMDPAEQDAYFRALYGDFEGQPEWDDSLTEEENQVRFDAYYEEREPSGCSELAWQEYSEQEQAPFAVYEKYSDEFEQMYADIESDPRIVQFEQEWVECMAQAGYEYADIQAMYDDLYTRQGELMGAPVSEEAVATTAVAGSSDETESEGFTSVPAEGDEPIPVDPAPVEPDPEQLAELRAYELEVAKANYDCDGGSAFGPPAVYDEVRFEFEQQFIEQHRAELETLRDAAPA